jgi:hypothetical protein
MNDSYSILPEHAAPPKPEASVEEYNPSLEEKKVIKQVVKAFEKAKKFKSQYDEKWLDWYKMFRGKQWKEQRPTYRHSEVLNLIFQSIQSQVPIITDTRPKFEFKPQEPADFELAEILNEVSQADWMKNNWMYELCEVIYDGHIYGTGFSCMKYDPDKMAISYRSQDPFYAFPDPEAKDVNKDSEYFCYAEPMEISHIKRKWKKGRYVKADLIDLMRGSKTDLGSIRFKSPTDSRTIIEGSSSPELDASKNKALVITKYCKDDEFEDETKEVTDPATGEPSIITESRLKYPNGKMIVVANEVLLQEGPNPYEHGEFPYQRWQNYVLPREFWGISEIENLEGPQKTFNKIISFVMDVMTLMGNPIWVVDNTADIDTDNLINRPGAIVEKSAGSEVRREEGTGLQPYVLQVIDRYKEWFDQIAGSNDITRGLNPSGVTAASAIADLQNAAQTRIRQKSRNLDVYLQQLGQQYVSLVFQFYTAPQVFRLTNKDGTEKYFKFHVQPETQTAYVERFSPEGQSLGMSEYQMRGKFDVSVSTGSSLPFSKAEKEQRLLNLFDRAIIDQEEVLKSLDYPNYEAVLQRMEQKAQMQAQEQAQAGAVPPAA